MCGFCTSGSDDSQVILQHILKKHRHENNIKIRRLELDPSTGKRVFISTYFDAPGIMEAAPEKTLIDFTEKIIRFKRPVEQIESDMEPMEVDQRIDSKIIDHFKTVKHIQEILPETLKLLDDDRINDFASVMDGLLGGTVSPDNVALQLLLDVGRYVRHESFSTMRYPKFSMDFWIVFYKIFKARAIRFMGGEERKPVPRSKGEPFEGSMRTFAVPSLKTLQHNCESFRIDLEKTGMIKEGVGLFAKIHKGDVKICLDGKKIAYGFGRRFGDEDLSGHEESPTLEERKQRLQIEMSVIEKVDSFLENLDVEFISESALSVADLRELVVILSNRVKDLRIIQKKNNYVADNLLKDVEGNWRAHKLAGRISHCRTIAIKCGSCITSLLAVIDDIMFYCAHMNGCGASFRRGKGLTVDLSQQDNYMCMREVDPTALSLPEDCEYVKQKSDDWFKLRQGAVITGSTFYNGLGFRTLKAQKEHYDRVRKNKAPQERSDEVKAAMKYGNDNEINALATLVGKIMPAFYPHLKFREDGCTVVDLKQNGDFIIVSGDGSGVNEMGENATAFEMKCPLPGKTFTTDLFYSVPKIYVMQILSQIHAKALNQTGVPDYGFISWNPESTTFMTGAHEPDFFDNILKLVKTVYAPDAKKPNKRHPDIKDKTQDLVKISEKSVFVAESLSCLGKPCDCPDKVDSKADGFKQHSKAAIVPASVHVQECRETLAACRTNVREAYQLCRKMAKEILVTMVSDLDRVKKSDASVHAVPVMYQLPGASMKMNSVRQLLEGCVQSLKESGLNVKAICSDSQFLELAVQNKNEEPLTMLKLDKYVWEKARKVRKDDQISVLSGYNHPQESINSENILQHFTVSRTEGGTYVISMKNYRQIHNASKKTWSTLNATTDEEDEEDEDDELNDDETDFLKQYLASDVYEAIHDDEPELIDAITLLNEAIARKRASQKTQPTPQGQIESRPLPPMRELYDTVLEATSVARRKKWEELESEQLKTMLTNAESIAKNFIVSELKSIVKLAGRKYRGNDKTSLTNQVSELFADGSSLALPIRSPGSLRSLAKTVLKKSRKAVTNVLYATNIYEEERELYEARAHFKSDQAWVVSADDEVFTIPYWYAQPDEIGGQLLVYVTDPHHLFVNNRSRVCEHGMWGMSVKKDAWHKVAKNKDQAKRTKLTLELVGLGDGCDGKVLDKQYHGYADITFSEEVEKCMLENGDNIEARWCRLFRHWYDACDGHGITLSTRIRYLIEMRSYLLQFYRAGQFPPPGGYVSGMPVAQFEGIMTGIDRRLQLYRLSETGTYNHRAISSNDNETFFSTIQVRCPPFY